MRSGTMYAGSSKVFVIVGLASVVALAVAARPAANYMGICVPELRRLDRQEQLRHVYEYLKARNLQTQRGVDGQIVGKLNNGFSYASYPAFIRANPACCSISLKGPVNLQIPTFERLTGARRAFVRIDYRTNWNGTDATNQIKTRHLLISNCGVVNEVSP